MTPPLLLRGVRKSWPGRRQPVLDDVTLEAPEGTLTWVGGENGAGKTTLLRIVCGLLAPDSGRVLVGPHDLERAPRECKRRIGFLAAGSTGLYARLTVRQQLDYWSRLAFVPRSERPRVVPRSIERFGLDGLADRRLDRISMGERQRVRLAMAFLHRPLVVLLDEPGTSLDSGGLRLLADALSEHRGRGGAAIWCSPTRERPHVPPDRELVVKGGRLDPP